MRERILATGAEGNRISREALSPANDAHHGPPCTEPATLGIGQAGYVAAAWVLASVANCLISTSRPWSRTRMRSQLLSVLKRWAIMKVVRPEMRRSVASMIAASV